VLEVEGSRIEKLAVNFERRRERRENGEHAGDLEAERAEET
jgi:hypothetical protein